MTETRKKRSLTEQSAWLLSAQIIGFALGVALPLLLVRRLSQEAFGLYKQAFLIILTATNVLPLGFQMSAYYFLPRDPEKRPQIIFNILLFNLAVGLIAFFVLLFAPQLLGAIFQADEMTRLAPPIGLVILFWIFSTFLETSAVANQEPRLATAFIVSAQLTKTLLLVGAAAWFGTVEALVYAALAQTILQTIILLVYLNSRFPRFWTAFSVNTFREQAVYALPLGFAALLWTAQLDLHNFFVSHRFTSAEFAVYAVGCFELPLIGMLVNAVSSVLIPRLSELESQNAPDKILELLILAMERLAFAFLPIFVFLMITAEQFIVALFTTNYAASVPIFRINLLILPFYIFIFDGVVRAYTDLGKRLLALRMFVFVALVAALWFGINNFDLRGMIAIVVAVHVFEKIVLGAWIRRKLNFTAADLPALKNVGKIALASLLAGAATFAVWYFLREWAALVNLIVCAAVFAPVYLAVIHFSGAIPLTERQRFFDFLDGILKRFRKSEIAPVES